ncbi:hypothetical protein [Clostridium sp. Marseille-P299]|uniref:hypothetical protein n=1 Tax=Clostridium sp. Marseille-P299 TaxID=1805477 RepID=UPI000A44C133|nr:hypothetical protein [Clostridium sp. Marseille-P299]
MKYQRNDVVVLTNGETVLVQEINEQAKKYTIVDMETCTVFSIARESDILYKAMTL